jgi:hypothetical protein
LYGGIVEIFVEALKGMGGAGLSIVLVGPYIIIALLLYLPWDNNRRTERWSDAQVRFVDVLTSVKVLIETTLNDEQGDAQRQNVCYEQIRAALQEILTEVRVLSRAGQKG